MAITLSNTNTNVCIDVQCTGECSQITTKRKVVPYYLWNKMTVIKNFLMEQEEEQDTIVFPYFTERGMYDVFDDVWELLLTLTKHENSYTSECVYDTWNLEYTDEIMGVWNQWEQNDFFASLVEKPLHYSQRAKWDMVAYLMCFTAHIGYMSVEKFCKIMMAKYLFNDTNAYKIRDALQTDWTDEECDMMNKNNQTDIVKKRNGSKKGGNRKKRKI